MRAVSIQSNQMESRIYIFQTNVIPFTIVVFNKHFCNWLIDQNCFVIDFIPFILLCF